MEPPTPIAELLAGEGAWVEWKKVGDPLKIAQKLVAYANDNTASGRGGWVVCGVEEKKDERGAIRPNLVGLPQGELAGLRNRVMEACREHVSPPIVPQVYENELLDDPTRRLMIFYTPASPYLHEHRTKEGSKVWVLFDSETREAKGELLRRLRSQKGELPPFLQRPCRVASMDDIYLTAADEFRREAGLPRPMGEYFEPGQTIDAVAPSLCLLGEIAPGKSQAFPTYLALLLFGRDPTRFIQGAYAIVSIYPGLERTELHSQRFTLTGPLVKLVRDVTDKLQGHMGVSMDKSRSALEIRQNRQRYSEKAVQEAVVNAFAHRDYELPEPVRVTVFSDRIEVSSPGTVTTGVDIEKLRAGQAVGARWRNPGLSSFLERMRVGVQAEGQGVPTIHRETLEVAERNAEYSVDAGRVTVVLPAYQPPPPSPRPSPPEMLPSDIGREGILLVSIGSPSLRGHVEPWLDPLGLGNADIVADISIEAEVNPLQDAWEKIAKQVRTEVANRVEDARYGRFHLFYRGPVLIAPVVGAVFAGVKPLAIYGYFDGKYARAYTLDRRFLRAKN